MKSGRLEGKVILVTGGGSGIGRATTQLFAREGAHVIVLDLDPNQGEVTAETLRLEGYDAIFMQADASNREQVQAAIQHIVDHFDTLDGLVNVVGVSGRRWGDGPVHTCTEEAWDRLMTINLKSVFLCSQAALPAMMAQRAGSIINVSSVLGLVGGDADFATHAYAATKGAIISLTRSLAVFYAPHGIRANVICPSLIATPMSRRAQENEGLRARLQELHPLTGAFGHPEDVAHAALYLTSDEARFVTGVIFPVDGGWTAK